MIFSKLWHWLGDTLAKRLFWLMWVTLVASHFVAFTSVTLTRMPGDVGAVLSRLPPMPSLPPMAGPRAPLPSEGGPPRPRGMTWEALALDYGIRIVLIALAAWWGSRWLARPMARLVEASHGLGTALDAGHALPRLDEARGTREVREAAQVFNRMAHDLKEQLDGRGLMIAALSHDLRTPLTRLRMRLETASTDAALRERSAADIREMNALIDSVLELFRGRQGGAPLQRVDVGALAQSLVDDLVEQGARVDGRCPSAVVRADALAVRRVLSNLLGNALRYAGAAQLRIEQDAQQVRLVVEDDGPGIPAAQLEAVFEPFFRVEGSRNRQSGGTGLGLYIARQLARRQGGELTLANRDAASGRSGLRAEFSLPR